MIQFSWPVAWLLVLPLAVHLWYRPSASRLLNVLRCLLYLALVLALSGPEIRLPERSGTVVALVDRSRSMPEDGAKEAERIIRRLAESRPAKSRLGVLSFGADTVIEKLPAAPGFDGLHGYLANRDASNLAGGLEQALLQIPAGESGRILLISDGAWTGERPERLFALAASRGIAVDFRELRRRTTDDLAIAGVEGPVRVAPGEFFTLQSRIVAPRPQRVRCRIRRNGGPWQSRELELRQGENLVSWRDRYDGAAVLDYRIDVADVAGNSDERPENNHARKLVEVSGRKPLLLLSQSPSGNLANLLTRAGLPLVVRKPNPSELTPEKLASYSGVILENVPAASLGMDGMALLSAMTRAGSLGVMLSGGRNSFAPGGYFRSPLEEILPVSMEQRQELRKSSLALMVALDRSGSMAAPIGRMTKMDMANLATLEAFRQLLPTDEFGVIAVDSSAHNVVSLGTIAGRSNEIDNKVRRIESMGGGIFTYTALKEAIGALRSSKAATRHLLLFADAADAEEPGEYQSLLAEATKQGISVSVVGLGSERDSDAVFLVDVAKRGGGACYFSDRPDELPRIFVQDTFMIARNTFLDTPVRGRYTAAAQLLAGAPLGKFTEFGGYNLCYAKPDSQQLLISEDEFAAPLAATGNANLGRVSAFMAEADGEYTGKFASDPAAGTLLAALVNWMRVPENSGADYLVTQRIDDGVLIVEIHLDPTRERDPWQTPPQINSVLHRSGEPNRTRLDALEWVAPDRMEARIPLEGDTVYLSTVSWAGARPVVLSPAVQPYSPEFRPETEARSALGDLAKISGGVERFAPEEIWGALPRRPRLVACAPFLLMLAMLLLLLETAERRLGWSRLFARVKLPIPQLSGRLKSERPRREHSPRRKTKPRSESEALAHSPVSPASPPETEETFDDLREALRKARRR